MKNFLSLILMLWLFGFTSMSFDKSTTTTPIRKSEKLASSDCKYGRCHATAKSTGKQCKHCVSAQGDMYCFQHKQNFTHRFINL